jgi:hypothetical protein
MAMEAYTLGLTASALNKMEGPDPWWGTGYQKRRFAQLARKHSVLNFSSNLQRETYTSSPIFKYLEGLRYLQYEGRVHVAFVPPGKGKTTACQVFFKPSALLRPLSHMF